MTNDLHEGFNLIREKVYKVTIKQQDNKQTEEQLNRHLSNRHIQLIAIGGAIGTGLFMGSGKTIHLAGPSILLVYIIIGLMLFFVMRAMGELLLSNLKYKSFIDFTTDLLGPMAGFYIGWTYWLCWIVTGIADLVAIASYVQYFAPYLAPWIPAVFFVLFFLCFNLLTVKLFGELEFWFAIIKVVAIVALIIVGLGFIVYGFTTPSGIKTSLANIWNDGGFFPTGFTGFIAGFQIAVFAFVGVELVGTTAAEAHNPIKTLPRAINAIPIRIILFYVLSLAVIMSVMPWRAIDPNQSPFIKLFTFAGIPIAATLVNFVVLTSAASSANSGIYSTSRMLFGLALTRKAPKLFGKLSRTAVPATGLLFSCICLLPAAIILYFNNKDIMHAFTLVTTMSTILFIFVWGLIICSYLAYRLKRPALHASSSYKMPWGLLTSGFCLVFFAALLVALAFKEDTRLALTYSPLWFILLGIAYLSIPKSIKANWHSLTQQEFSVED